MKVLIVSYSFPPANAPAAQRPYSLAKYLNKDKFEVSVLTCANQDSSLGFDNNFNFDIDDVELHKVKSFNTSAQREVKKNTMQVGKFNLKQKFKKTILNVLTFFVFPDRAVIWLPFLIPYIIKNKKRLRADIIVSTSPAFTNHLAARFLKKMAPEAIHIADFRDFHYIHNYELKNGVKPFLNKLVEKWIIRKADKAIFISDSMKTKYAEKYPREKNKFFTVYNGYDDNKYLGKFKIDASKLSIFYAGSFYDGVRSPKPLLCALENIIKTGHVNANNIKIEIAGNIEQKLIEEIKDLSVFKSIVFLGQIGREDVLKKYCQSHLLWLIVGNEINHYTGVPIKMFEYLASGRYILNFAPERAESRSIIDKSNAGWNFENKPDSSQNIINLKKIIDLYQQGQLEATTNISNLNQFKKSSQIAYLEKLL